MATVNYNDERFAEVEQQKQQALAENEKVYAGMIEQSDQFYQAQVDATKQWEETQKQLQQEQTDFTLEQIEQQKEQAQKDYIKEQKGAFADWQKQSNQYGAEAEQMAANGLTSSGFSESSKVGMYTAYQNRVATAREGFSQIVLNYDNSMKEAMLQNNSALAEIALNSLQQQLQYLLEGFQYENTLLLDQANKKLEIDSMYHSRYQEVLDQINYEEQMAYQKTQDDRNYQLQLQQLAEDKRQFDEKFAASGGSASISGNLQQIKTQYYSGPIAEDVGEFGYMGKDNNGVAYQPKGVYVIHNGQAIPMKLKKSGKTAQQMFGEGSVNSSGVNIDKQNVWTAGGQYFIWNGTKNKYERVG